MANHLRVELVIDALQMAIEQRRPRGVIHHSIKGASTLRFPLENDAGKQMSDRPWDRLEIVTITHSVRASLPRWNASFSIGIDSGPGRKQEEPRLSSSKVGSIRIAAIHRSAMHCR